MFRRLIEDAVAASGRCRILDIGGTRTYWDVFASHLEWERVEVTIANLNREGDRPPKIRSVIGDGRNLSQFPDGHFDIVHSNSVIEHVGRWCDMQRMANEIRRLAPEYFVQTPYFWFPFDPHTRTPLFHWMPDQMRYRIAMMKDCGAWKRCKTIGDAMRIADDARLLDWRQMNYLFPDAEIVRERAFGMTKSLIAIRH
jgi:SAM-dependent methyltransferase